MTNISPEPFDDITVNIGGVALDRGGQVEDDRPFGGGLDDLHHCMTDVEGELWFGEREALGRVLVADLTRAHGLLELSSHLCRVHGDVDDAALVQIEHHLALQRIGAVVEVHDRLVHSLQTLVGALEQLLATLHQHLDGDVFGNQVLVDQLTHKIEIGLAGGWKADFDLLESHLHECVEHAPLTIRIHRVDERLVAIAEIDAAPQRGLLDSRVRPRAVGEHQWEPRLILLEGHLLWGDVWRWHWSAPDGALCLCCEGNGIEAEKTRTPCARAQGD